MTKDDVKQYYKTKASQYAQMFKTLDPSKNLQVSHHTINQNIKPYQFPITDPTVIPPCKQIVQKMRLQELLEKTYDMTPTPEAEMNPIDPINPNAHSNILNDYTYKEMLADQLHRKAEV